MIPHSHHDRKQLASEAGLTLMELLVSLTLLAMLMVVIPSTLRLTARAWQTSAELVEGRNPTDAVRYLERQLAEVMPLFEKEADGALRTAFRGSNSELSYVAPLPAGPAGGGLFRFELMASGAGEAGTFTLDLRIAEFRPSAQAPEAAALIEERRLLSNLLSVAFRYFGSPQNNEAPQWLDTWTRRDRLPELIELSIRPRGTGPAPSAPLRVELRLGNRA